MGFHANHTHGATGYTGQRAPQKKAKGGCACGCDGRGPDPEKGGDLEQVARAMAVASKVDHALERHAPITTNGNKPLGPSAGFANSRTRISVIPGHAFR